MFSIHTQEETRPRFVRTGTIVTFLMSATLARADELETLGAYATEEGLKERSGNKDREPAERNPQRECPQLRRGCDETGRLWKSPGLVCDGWTLLREPMPNFGISVGFTIPIAHLSSLSILAVESHQPRLSMD